MPIDEVRWRRRTIVVNALPGGSNPLCDVRGRVLNIEQVTLWMMVSDVAAALSARHG